MKHLSFPRQKFFSRYAFAGLLGLLLALTGGFSQGVAAGEAVERLQAFFSEKGTLRAQFVQEVQGAAFSQPEGSRGVLMMQRPGKFRWNYQAPYEQQIVADGERLWIYDMDLEQVVVKPLDEALGDTPALLLSGKGSVDERFQVRELSPTEGGMLWVELTPKQKESGFETLRLGFQGKELLRMELKDAFGQLTRLSFSSHEHDVALPADTFRFVPPKGVDVVGDPGR